MNASFENKVALITGAGSGMGLVTARAFAVSQALIWLAPWSTMAFFGAAVIGLGYSLVYPGFGVEAVRHAPPQSRGLDMAKQESRL